jgi:ATPase subunit of ABC transporter with duplicated ATPase domains
VLTRYIVNSSLHIAGYLKQQEIPMVIVSHDREFLDQLCTKIVHTEFGLAQTFAGNYTRFTNAREEAVAQQWAAWEKQQKEIARQVTSVDVWLCYPSAKVFSPAM